MGKRPRPRTTTMVLIALSIIAIGMAVAIYVNRPCEILTYGGVVQPAPGRTTCDRPWAPPAPSPGPSAA